jgi:5-methyltetrahydrofolate--homocysteine methyltransferase
VSDVLGKIKTAVIEHDVDGIVALTQQALKEGLTPKDVLDNGLVPGMDYVGVQFRKGDMFVPEVLFSARAMQTSLSMLKPLFAETGATMLGKVVLGTVKGDLHDIGKDLVGMMLEGAGFEVIDLGKDVAPEAFVRAVREHKPDVVGMSALLTTTMTAMGATIKALQEAGLRSQIKVIVGGAPLTTDFAQRIGADGYGASAPAAVDLARRFAPDR